MAPTSRPAGPGPGGRRSRRGTARRCRRPGEGARAPPGQCLPARLRTYLSDGQGTPCCLARTGRQPLVEEALQPAALIGLHGVQVALRVGGDVVQRVPLAGIVAALAEVGELLHRLAIEDAQLLVAAVGHVEVLLLRVARERGVPHRAVAARVARHVDLPHERAVDLEDLQPVAGAVAHVDEPVVGHVGAVHRAAELLVGGGRVVRALRHGGLVVRRLAVGAPEALHLAGLRVDHGDAPVAVAVGHEHFVGRLVEERLGHLEEVVLGQAVAGHALLADLHHELAVLRELQTWPSWRRCRRSRVALVVDVEPVVRGGPLVARAVVAAPVAQQVARLIELENRRRPCSIRRSAASGWPRLRPRRARRAGGRSRRDPGRRPTGQSSGPDTSRSAAAWGRSDRLRTAAPSRRPCACAAADCCAMLCATHSAASTARNVPPIARFRFMTPYLPADELLNALAVMLLARVDVALRVDRDAADREELARLAAAAAEAPRPPPACRAAACGPSCRGRRPRTVALLRIVRERDVPHRACDDTTPNWPGHGRAQRVLRDDASFTNLPSFWNTWMRLLLRSHT